MEFHDIRYPANLSFGSTGGPERRTEIVTLANGFEERNTSWADSLHRYDAGSGLRSLDDLSALIAFFEARKGPLYGFRWKDWSDYKSGLPSQATTETDTEIGRGDGVTAVFQLQKVYLSGPSSYSRPITKPVAGTVKVAVAGLPKVEGTEFTYDETTGLLTFAFPPDIDALVTAGFEFDVPVRFDTDRISVSVASFQAGEVPDVPVVEVRI
jgi:uncharacterized protein (TIGR02217 family)